MIELLVFLYILYVIQTLVRQSRERHNMLLYGTPYAPISGRRRITVILVMVLVPLSIWGLHIRMNMPYNSGLMSTKYEPVFSGEKLVPTEPSYLTPWADRK